MFRQGKLNLLVLFFVFIVRLDAFDIELTVLIPANQRECFHQVLEVGKTIESEYEVLAGGDFDVNFWIYSPTNRILKSDYKKRDGHQTFKLEESGEYRFCFDNSFSRFSDKQVYFSLRPIYEEGQQSEHPDEEWIKQMAKDDLGELQNKVQDLKVFEVFFHFV